MDRFEKSGNLPGGGLARVTETAAAAIVLLVSAALLLALHPTAETPSRRPTASRTDGGPDGRSVETDWISPGRQADAVSAQPPTFPGPGGSMESKLANLPLYFIENQGQLDSRVSYYLQGTGTSVYFTREGVTFALTEQEPSVATPGSSDETEVARRRWAVKLDFVGANTEIGPMGQDLTSALVSYFKGGRADWQTGLATYGSVVYRDLWPGIDLVYTGTDSRLKYTFVVQPGADPNRIQLAYRGATDVRLTEEGRLSVWTPVGGFEDDSPYAYQETGDERDEVEAAFVLQGDNGSDGYRYGFRVGTYDKTKPLILDPVILAYCGYIGGANLSSGSDIAVDASGNAYIVGYTGSSEASFPVTVGPDTTYAGGNDAFVAKVNSSGTALIYAGYIGGSGTDKAWGITVDSSGNAYVSGNTSSTESSFPVTVGPDTTYNGGTDDAFVAKVNASGTALIYAGYIGGSGTDYGNGIAVDGSGNAYVVGYTGSTEGSFPVTVGPDTTYNGGTYDAFVAKVNASGTALTYAGYIGGSGTDYGEGIALDGSGNAYVIGRTDSTEASFPVTVGPDTTYNGGSFDVFVAKVNASGAGLSYAGYIGGSASDLGSGIAVDSSGSAYVVGDTGSTEASFPVTVGPDLTYNGLSWDVFVAKVNSAGTALTYAGYIGGSSTDFGEDIAVDSDGNAYVVGWTNSDETSFPVKMGPDTTWNGSYDAFVAKVNASGTGLTYCGYIGGSSNDNGDGIALDASGNVYIVGDSFSSEASFPVTVGPDKTLNAIMDAFVAKLIVGKVSQQRSIGSYSTGNASVTAPPPPADSSTTVTFAGGASLPTDILPGDALVIDPGGANQEAFSIVSRDSATQLTVSAPATIEHTGEPYYIYWIYSTGDASVAQGATTVTFAGGASLPTRVGVGDELTLDPGGTNEETLYVQSRISATELTVQSSALIDHSTPESYTLERAYKKIQDWETDRQGDLVDEDRMEVGLAYNDGPFHENVLIDGAIADSSHFMRLTVAEGHRHSGTAAGSHVVLDPDTAGHAFEVRSDYFMLEWFEITDWGTAAPNSSFEAVRVQADNTLSQFLIIHSDNRGAEPDSNTDGIFLGLDNATMTIRNSIIYDISRAGIHLQGDSGKTGRIVNAENVTVYNTMRADAAGSPNDYGGVVNTACPGCQFNAKNLIVFDSSPGADFGFFALDGEGDWGTSDFNMSSDGSSKGPDISSGTTDASGNTGTTVVVTGATFVTDGVVAGDWFYNSTDLSSSQIASVDSETQLTLMETGVTGNTKSFSINNSARYRLAVNQFVSLTGGAEDLHLKAGADAIDVGTDLSANFFVDIDAQARPAGAGWDQGADEIGAATAVELSSFGASGLDGEVLLLWATGSELDNLGFHLYRSLKEAGPYERITKTVIPGLGSSPVGANYTYRDSGLINGVTYYYKLEDIETTGRTELHGPVSATPEVGASSSSSVDESSPTSTSLITYGDPSASSLRVLKRGRGQVVLELTTGGFYAEPQEDGTVHITIPDFAELGEAGSPSMPVKRTWVEAIAGRKVELVSVQARGLEAFTSLRPSGAALAEIVATREGTVRASRRRLRAAFRKGELYPSEAARFVSVGFQGEVKKALVELAPLRWDEATGRLLLVKRLVVRLAFRGREPGERSTDGVRGRRYRWRASHDERRVVARLATTERGLHAVRYEDVFRRSGRGVRASALRLSRQGETVAFHLAPSSERFRRGSVLYFVSEGASANLYGRDAVYELEVGQSGERMPELSSAPSGEATSFYWKHLEQEQNRYYQAALVEAPDRWLWDLLFAPVVKRYPFEVSALASTTEPSSLSVWLQGVSDFRANPDHHVRVSVNGSFLEDVAWNGKTARRIDVELPPGVVLEGENLLELENVGDTDAAYSMVMLDRFRVSYPRLPVAQEGKLEGSWSTSGVAWLSGLGSGAHVLDVTEEQPQWLSETRLGSDGVLRFRAESARSYLAVSLDAVLRPEVRKVWASGLKNTRNRADYLVIGPRAFLEVAQPLLELRRNQGLEVKGIAIEDLYEDFGFGETTPQAVKDFLSYAYHNWEAPSPRYVVLLGDATYDFKDYLRTGVSNQVPPLMVKTTYLWTTSDPTYASVNGEDLLPDLAIGRLPAATVEEARAMVGKIVAYETGDVTLEGTTVLVADNADRAGNFQADAEKIASTLLSSREVKKIYLSQLSRAATRSAIVEAFDEGASLMSYLGHGGIVIWASENVFNLSDVDSLEPQAQQPLLLTMNCLNGYFHFPYFNSLSEELVKAEGKGAIAAFSPSGLSLNTPAHLYHKALLQELFNGSHERLGDAVLAAQEAYAETGAFPELLSIYHLLGDPALRLK